jgi:DNA-binding HxlR family transcriptional regulator
VYLDLTNDLATIDLIVDNRKLTTQGKKVELIINGIPVYDDALLGKLLTFKRPKEDFETLNVVFAANAINAMFGHPERYRIVTAIEKEPKTFTEIEKKLKLKPATLNFHMKKLQSEMIVGKAKKDRRYFLTIIGRAMLEHFLNFFKKVENTE